MYRGPTAMSEPEVQNIANFLLDRIDCMRVYISLHSYSQFWFTRWSFADVLPPDHIELVSVQEMVAQEMCFQETIVPKNPIYCFRNRLDSMIWFALRSNHTCDLLIYCDCIN